MMDPATSSRIQKEVFLRLDTKDDGIYMESYHMTIANETTLGDKLSAWISLVEGLPSEWIEQMEGRGTRKNKNGTMVRPRSIKLSGLAHDRVEEEINRFISFW